ncbi:GNAT family N-acetyltransferase [Pseudomonas parafulva]|uniref:GNAT family N-acetyltransferase n=1 Tax=Pseudomonas parafulva TaxID=157782 RepID=UPI000B19B6E2|nr:GNAT family N-acetyltransferase [Pseudomonas parafulva]
MIANRLNSRSELPPGVRRYTPEDLPTMTAIFNESALGGTSSPVLRAFSLEEMTFFVDCFVKEGDPIYVLERGGEVVAWLIVNRFSWGAQACRLTGEVSIYVRHDHVGSGVGIRLGQAAVVLARRYGFETLVAWIIEHNAASKRGVQGLGAAQWGRFPGIARFAELRADVVLYGLHLTSEPSTESDVRVEQACRADGTGLIRDRATPPPPRAASAGPDSPR